MSEQHKAKLANIKIVLYKQELTLKVWVGRHLALPVICKILKTCPEFADELLTLAYVS